LNEIDSTDEESTEDEEEYSGQLEKDDLGEFEKYRDENDKYEEEYENYTEDLNEEVGESDLDVAPEYEDKKSLKN
jgi:hypothetical protein